MEVHQTLRKVAEESLTLEDCKFLLSKTGEKQSKILYENYCRKYHPTNSSLTSYFNRRLLQHLNSYHRPMKARKLAESKVSASMSELPLLRKEKKTAMSDKWEGIIRMTQKQNIVRKGCQFPKIGGKK